MAGASTAAAESIVERELVGTERGREGAPPKDTNRFGLKRVRAEAQQRRGAVGERRPADAAVQAAAGREAAEECASAAELRELYGMAGASSDAVDVCVAGASSDAVDVCVAGASSDAVDVCVVGASTGAAGTPNVRLSLSRKAWRRGDTSP